MAVQAPQLYFCENLGLPTAVSSAADWCTQLNPASGLDDIFSSFPSPQPRHNHQDHRQFHREAAQIQTQNQDTLLAFDCCNQLGFSSVSSATSTNSFQFSEALSAQLELQRQELDCIIQLQNEKLRVAMQEQRRQQLAALLSNLESRSLSLIRQKDEDLAEATRKAMELRDSLRKAEMESDTWQRVAKANETMAMELNNTLEQVRERLVLVTNEAADAESSCGPSVCDRDGVKLMEENKNNTNKLDCKSCKSRRSCVLFLPCRHLCSCKFCEAFLGSCPVCESTKEASMEIFLV